MKVYLLSIADQLPEGVGSGIDRCALEKLTECARKDRFGEHALTDEPAEADLIIFAEMGTTLVHGLFDRHIRAHPLMRRYPDRCFVLNSADLIVPYLPGLYASVEARAHDPRRDRSVHYISSHISSPPSLHRPWNERDFLFSFVGNAANHPVRGEVMRLAHKGGYCRDVGAKAADVWRAGAGAVDQFLGDYADVMSRSRFALCPRGRGASSMRLFESLRFGVAPVIISDQWVAPTGPAWEDFCVRVPERDVGKIPQLLEELDGRSEQMGLAAGKAWDEWFADEVTFHRVVGWCKEIMETRGLGGDSRIGALRASFETLRPHYLRKLVREVRAGEWRGSI